MWRLTKVIRSHITPEEDVMVFLMVLLGNVR